MFGDMTVNGCCDIYLLAELALFIFRFSCLTFMGMKTNPAHSDVWKGLVTSTCYTNHFTSKGLDNCPDVKLLQSTTNKHEHHDAALWTPFKEKTAIIIHLEIICQSSYQNSSNDRPQSPGLARIRMHSAATGRRSESVRLARWGREEMWLWTKT